MKKLKDLVLKNRSYRRYRQDYSVSIGVLRELIDLARLSPSGGNLQPLKYIISSDRKTNNMIFPCLSWAGYIKNWAGPIEGERPSAYIVVLGGRKIKKTFGYEAGIACQSILLGAVEKGLGGCIIGSINRAKLRKALHISKYYEILLVLAIGKPVEKIKIEKIGSSGDIKYWRDAKGVHHMPKRSLEEIILC